MDIVLNELNLLSWPMVEHDALCLKYQQLQMKNTLSNKKPFLPQELTKTALLVLMTVHI